jgi:hypothetical protein
MYMYKTYEVCPDDFRKGAVSGAAIGWEVA